MRTAHAVLVKWADLEILAALRNSTKPRCKEIFSPRCSAMRLVMPDHSTARKSGTESSIIPIAGETPDAVLGFFRQTEDHKPLAVIELKGPKVHLDRHRRNGRTAVAQCWDYLVNTPPECRWGIVSNIVSFRLYERTSTKRMYEHFTLQSLRDFDSFRQFYMLFHRQGLIEESLLGPPRTVALLKKSAEHHREIGDKLYDAYSCNRNALIAELHFKQKYPLDAAD